MALSPHGFYADLSSFREAAPFTFSGVAFDQLAQAISYSMVAWAPSVQLTGLAVGSAGVGTVTPATTRVVVPANPALAIRGLAGAGMVGPVASSLGSVVGQAIPKTLTTFGQYAGGVVGVGLGADVSKVTVANPVSLVTLLRSFMVSLMGPGPALSMMVQGLATAISDLVLAGTGTGSVQGSSSLAPASGTSSSVLV